MVYCKKLINLAKFIVHILQKLRLYKNGGPMNYFLVIVFLYFIGCVLGWCLEVVYRRFSPANKERKWINPGFLVGPYLPLYGFGLCTLFFLARLEQFINLGSNFANKAVLFIVMAISMTVLELIAGLIFIQGMNVKLWDYSKEWLNYKGIICPKFSLFWALLGAFYYFAIDPDILSALAWFKNNLAFSFILGIFIGCHFIDFCYSTHIVVKIKKYAEEYNIKVKYEELKNLINLENIKNHERKHFFFSFNSDVSLSDHLKKYADLTIAFIQKPELKLKDSLKNKKNK